MKFALYQPWIYLHGGLERSILNLVTRSRHEWVIYTSYYAPKGTFPEFQQLDVRVVGRASVQRNFAGVLASAMGMLNVKLPLSEDVDALVVWCDGIGDLVVFRNRTVPILNICSTPLRAVFDPVYEETLKREMKPYSRFLYQIFKVSFRWIDRLAWRRYKLIVTTSSEVKRRIIRGGLCRDESRMVMSYPGVDWKPEVTIGHPEQIMLLAGRIMWTKNIQQAIRAFLISPPPEPWRLVVAGYVDRKSQVYLRELKEIARHPRIEFHINPTDSDLAILYQRAAFCLFTALNEDWGLVPLEAMAHGKCVIANARGGPAESIVDGVTGLLVEPNDESWSGAINRLTSTPEIAMTMGIEAHRRMRRYTWTRFVDTVDNALELATSARSSQTLVGDVAAAITPVSQSEDA